MTKLLLTFIPFLGIAPAGSGPLQSPGKVRPAPAVLATRLAKGPALVVFMKADCPCNERCVPELNWISQTLAPTAEVVAVVDLAPGAPTAQFAKNLGLRFRVVADPKGALRQSAGAACSLDLAVVDGQRRVERLYPGYDRAAIADAISRLSALSGRSGPVPDLSFLPDETQTGCRFAPSSSSRRRRP
jgi:hypothetical protein